MNTWSRVSNLVPAMDRKMVREMIRKTDQKMVREMIRNEDELHRMKKARTPEGMRAFGLKVGAGNRNRHQESV